MFRHIIDRSDLNQTVSVRPAAPGRVAKTTTLREELETREFHRADIVLFNGTRSGKEYCIYVTPTGFMGDMWILDVLSNEEYLQVQEIAAQMRQNVQDCPPAGKLLRGW